MESEEAKQALMQHAGVSSWDVTDPDTVTDEDYRLFGSYLTARIFSIPAVHVTIPSMCNNAYGRDYTVDVKVDRSIPLTSLQMISMNLSCALLSVSLIF